MPYLISEAKPDKLNISEGARLVGVTHQRFSRALKALKIPVTTTGYIVLFEEKRLAQIRQYLIGKKDGMDQTPRQ